MIASTSYVTEQEHENRGVAWRSHRAGRRGFGVAVMIAASLPALIMIGALANSMRSSAARRQTTSMFSSYVAVELAESAIAEATHMVRVTDVLDPSMYRVTEGTQADIPGVLLSRMMLHPFKQRLPGMATTEQMPAFPDSLRLQYEYLDILTQEGAPAPAAQLLTAINFPVTWRPVARVSRIREVAEKNPGIVTDGPEDAVVYVRPITLRREFYPAPPQDTDLPPEFKDFTRSWKNLWVNWGILQFQVKVRVRESKGMTTYVLKVSRMFTLSFGKGPDGEALVVSSRNLSSNLSEEYE